MDLHATTRRLLRLIGAGHDNKTARTVAIRQDEATNAPALSAMFKQIIANNRAGGWRKLKRERLTPKRRARDTLICRKSGEAHAVGARLGTVGPRDVRSRGQLLNPRPAQRA
jgi:hypothetical protein